MERIGEVYTARFATPFAVIGIRTCAEKLVRVEYLPSSVLTSPPQDALAREVCRQIDAYLADPLHCFDLPCEAKGTPFQRRVWCEIARIPSGMTRSYGELAILLKSAPRPVGGACGSNPIPLIVPCHRVLAANGQMGGFMHSRDSLPLSIKRWLLAHEGR